MYLEMVEGGWRDVNWQSRGMVLLNDDKFLAGTDGFTELAWSSCQG